MKFLLVENLRRKLHSHSLDQPYVYLMLTRLYPQLSDLHSSIMNHAKFFIEESTIPKEPELNQGTNRTFCMHDDGKDGLLNEFHKMISKAKKEIFEGWDFMYTPIYGEPPYTGISE